MKDVTPFRDHQSGPEGGAGRILERAEPGEPWSLDRQAAVFWAIRRQLAAETRTQPRRRRALFACGVAALGLALLVAGVSLLSPSAPTAPGRLAQVDGLSTIDSLAWTRWRRFDLADLACIEADVEEGFEVRELPNERQLRLTRGILRAHVFPQDPARPVVVITPHLKVVVVGTRFDIESTPELTTIALIEGRVRVESPHASVLLEGGASIRSDDPALNPPVPTPAPSPAADRRPLPRGAARAEPSPETPTLASCRGLPLAEQKRCFARLARGDGLAAQNALFALGEIAIAEGRTADAAAHFRRYGERFPSGALAPEAALGLFELLKEQGRAEAAIAAAEDFESRFASDSRAREVAVLRAALLCANPQQRQRAAAILNEVRARGVDPALREEVDRVGARCGIDAPEAVPHSAPAPHGAGGSRGRD